MCFCQPVKGALCQRRSRHKGRAQLGAGPLQPPAPRACRDAPCARLKQALGNKARRSTRQRLLKRAGMQAKHVRTRPLVKPCTRVMPGWGLWGQERTSAATGTHGSGRRKWVGGRVWAQGIQGRTVHACVGALGRGALRAACGCAWARRGAACAAAPLGGARQQEKTLASVMQAEVHTGGGCGGPVRGRPTGEKPRGFAVNLKLPMH